MGEPHDEVDQDRLLRPGAILEIGAQEAGKVLSTANLGYLAIDEPVLYDWLNSLTGAFNALQKQVGVDAAPSAQTVASRALSAPKPPASLFVSGQSGVFNIRIGASAGAAPGIQYFLEVSTDSGFTAATTTVYPVGNTLGLALSLGSGSFYFRTRAKYPCSDYSPYTYAGTADSPTPFEAGGIPQPLGGAVVKIADYYIAETDDGYLIVANSASAITFTLPPVPPSSTWKVLVANVGTGTLTLTSAYAAGTSGAPPIDGQTSLAFGPYQGAYVSTDGANYYTMRG